MRIKRDYFITFATLPMAATRINTGFFQAPYGYSHQTEYPEGYSVFLCPLHNIRARLGLFLCPAPGVCSERPFYHSKRPPFSRFSKLISTPFSPKCPKPSTAKRRGFPPGFPRQEAPLFCFFSLFPTGASPNVRFLNCVPFWRVRLFKSQTAR